MLKKIIRAMLVAMLVASITALSGCERQERGAEERDMILERHLRRNMVKRLK